MYVEISPRRSGKTTRLIRYVNSELYFNRDSIAVVYSLHQTYWEFRFKRDFSRAMQERVFVIGSLEHYRNFLANKTTNPIFACDEFDLFSPDNIPFRVDGYYVTTPVKLRSFDDFDNYEQGSEKDTLLEIVSMNGWAHTKHYGKDSLSLMRGAYQSMSIANRMTELNGEWIHLED